jgi:hypothetical protein
LFDQGDAQAWDMLGERKSAQTTGQTAPQDSNIDI